MPYPVPIALFTFKKLTPLKKAIAALKKNDLAAESELFIFSDAAAKPEDKKEVEEVREYIATITGFKKVTINEAAANKGLANSIIVGVSELLQRYEALIVLEDDLLTSPNFLRYMNAALRFYGPYEDVLSVAGYTPPIAQLPEGYAYDTYFTLRASSWGWATWKKQWETVDWSMAGFHAFKTNRREQRRFNQMGSDMTRLLSQQAAGKLDSWAIRWCFHQFQHQLYSVFPVVSKIQNIGFVAGATHTKGQDAHKRFATPLDAGDAHKFNFCPKVGLDKHLIKQFVRPYSFKVRLSYKIKNILNI
ncbi:sugar transferase [Maribacter sp. 2307ULW6-5]|uniref:sugar transferase n=1 Tax=Maribacter sp. 2307ULW6-5 TaxID=3386275 RepID=UPI0039BD84E4